MIAERVEAASPGPLPLAAAAVRAVPVLFGYAPSGRTSVALEV
ncbi:hypothetical protein [Streptomyces sp. NPDC001123]